MSKICRTFAAENERIMKKMYKNPKTEVQTVNTERMMDTPMVSGGGSASEQPGQTISGD